MSRCHHSSLITQFGDYLNIGDDLILSTVCFRAITVTLFWCLQSEKGLVLSQYEGQGIDKDSMSSQK